MITIHNNNDERYVSSKDLHKVLSYSQKNYARDMQKWLNTPYLFPNKTEFSLPVKNYDYIPSSRMRSGDYQGVINGIFADDFLIRLELAKLIALDSNSRFKQRFVQWLLTLENKVENLQYVSKDLVLALLEMARLCSYIDNQFKYYREHKDIWMEFLEKGEYAEFDKWRNQILKIDYYKKVEEQYHISYVIGKARTKIERLAFLDSLESVRNSMFDYLKIVMHRIDPLFHRSTEKALDLANFTRKMYESFGMKVDLKPRHYKPNEQIDMFRDIETIDYDLIAKGLAQLT